MRFASNEMSNRFQNDRGCFFRPRNNWEVTRAHHNDLCFLAFDHVVLESRVNYAILFSQQISRPLGLPCGRRTPLVERNRLFGAHRANCYTSPARIGHPRAAYEFKLEFHHRSILGLSPR